MATIVHFDISADNPERAKTFYETLFNWKIELLPGGMNYYMIETADLAGVKGIGGGMAKREPGQETGITNFIGVSSVDETVKKVEQLGGKIVVPKQLVPGFGLMTVCLDTENNKFGLFQEDPNVV
jgi:uncharacterized protein